MLRGLLILMMLASGYAYTAERYALLVSVGAYRDPEISNLPPSEDADLLARVLRDRWGFKAENLFILKEEQATKSAIMAKLQAIAQRVQPDDAVLFFFSGHGGTTSQHFTLCPWDAQARSADSDITEAELARWVQELKTTNVTIILDCCFEKITTKAPQIRPKAIGFAGVRGSPKPHTLSIPAERAVLLKASQEDEQAMQEISAEGDASYGVFTYNLVSALRTVPPETTYRQLVERLRSDVIQYIHSVWPSEHFIQTPRLAGSEQQQNRRLFEANGKPLPPYRRITRVDGDKVELDAGESAGVLSGSRYAIYPPEEEVFDDSHRLGLIEVIEVRQAVAVARIVEGQERIIPNCRARLIQYPDFNLASKCRLSIEAPEPQLTELRNAVRQLGFIELIDGSDHLQPRDWVLKVRSSDGGLQATLYESDGKTPVQRVEVTDNGDVRTLIVTATGTTVDALIQQMRPVWINFYAARTLLNLKNSDPRFKIELRTDKERYQEGDYFKVHVKSDTDCYLILIAIDPTGTPTVLHPWRTNQPQKVSGGKEYVFEGPSSEMKWVIKPPTGRECLIAIATLQEVSPNLEQLMQMLGQLNQAKVESAPPLSGIKVVTPVRELQRLSLDKWNIAVCHFLSTGKDEFERKQE